MDSKKLIDAVSKFELASPETKTNFLDRFNLDLPNKKITITFEVDLDKTSDSGPAFWSKGSWNSVLNNDFGDQDQIAIDYFKTFRNAVTVLSVEKSK